MHVWVGVYGLFLTDINSVSYLGILELQDVHPDCVMCYAQESW